jgi:hypothetical protein
MTTCNRRANSAVLIPVDERVDFVVEGSTEARNDFEALLATLSIVCLPVLESVDCLKLLGAGRGWWF